MRYSLVKALILLAAILALPGCRDKSPSASEIRQILLNDPDFSSHITDITVSRPTCVETHDLRNPMFVGLVWRCIFTISDANIPNPPEQNVGVLGRTRGEMFAIRYIRGERDMDVDFVRLRSGGWYTEFRRLYP